VGGGDVRSMFVADGLRWGRPRRWSLTAVGPLSPGGRVPLRGIVVVAHLFLKGPNNRLRQVRGD